MCNKSDKIARVAYETKPNLNKKHKPKLSSMKKISTLLMAAAALSFSANAVEPVEIEIANPSFEEVEGVVFTSGRATVTGFAGWSVMGSAAMNEDGSASGFFGMQDRNKSWSNGRYGQRTAAQADITGANYVYQGLTGVTPGIYVLQFDGQISRDSWQNELIITNADGEVTNTFYGFAYIKDNYPSAEPNALVPGVATAEGDGITALWTTGQPSGRGDKFFKLWRYFVIHVCSPDTYTDGDTDLEFGFGFPNNVDAEGNPVTITKANFAFDNFVLRRFDTTNVDEVKAWVNAEIAKIEAGDYSAPVVPDGGTEEAPVPMNVKNPFGDVNIPLMGFVTNSGWEPSTGINDIVAPVVKNDKYYNLQGIEIAKPTQAGIYIHNGKKYIVR